MRFHEEKHLILHTNLIKRVIWWLSQNVMKLEIFAELSSFYFPSCPNKYVLRHQSIKNKRVKNLINIKIFVDFTTGTMW